MLIAQVTDIHLGFEPDSPGEFNRQRLDRVLGELAVMQPRPDLLIATGDLIDRGDKASYERLREAFSGLPFPVHYALGNHDARAPFAEVFPEAVFEGGFLQYVIEGAPLRLIVLDTLEEGRHGGAFCEARAAWLNAQLDAAAEARNLIVLHHPPFEAGIPWMNTDPAEPWVERLAACVRGRTNIVGMVCGHIHRPIAAAWEGTIVTTCPSTAPLVALDLRAIDPDQPDERNLIIADPPAYALHWYNGRELVTHWDTAEDHQVLAKFDANLTDMVREMLSERPEAL